ncbi:SWIM zinc finger family protein [Oxalobacteraceae bacterium]|nr:SWIM zinc finger family protein [Oxalobacteraceae bacterium]
MTLTTDQILALAPDPASAKAGSAQSSQSKWSGLGGHAQALWGLCQGSGKDPYKAQIELAGPAFKCSCPSRKFPCKHGLGLYLLYASNAAAFAGTNAPDWVSDWLQSREQRSEKKAAKLADAEAAQTPAELAAREQGQQKRQERREGNVEAGLAVLDTWLADLARDGLAGLRSKPAKDWETMAARLVDSQAAGLAARVRRAGMLIYGSSAHAWEVPVARELAQLALLSQGYRNMDSLPAALRQDVRSAIGWVLNQDEVLAAEGSSDLWTVCGNHTQDEARVSRRACYLHGQRSGRWAMLLQFSAGAQALPPPLLPGTAYQGTVHFYPGAAPLRVAFGADMQMSGAAGAANAGVGSAPAPASDITGLLTEFAHVLARNPFTEHHPMLLEQVIPQQLDGQFVLRAQDGALLPIDPGFRHGWQLHALAGGAPVRVCGLWNGYALLPLAVTCHGRPYTLDGGSGQ